MLSTQEAERGGVFSDAVKILPSALVIQQELCKERQVESTEFLKIQLESQANEL